MAKSVFVLQRVQTAEGQYPASDRDCRRTREIHDVRHRDAWRGFVRSSRYTTSTMSRPAATPLVTVDQDADRVPGRPAIRRWHGSVVVWGAFLLDCACRWW